jgi:hypothetical protein
MKIRILVSGCRMLEKRSAPAAQALAPGVLLLLYIKQAEYLVNPVSSIQYPASWPITRAA